MTSRESILSRIRMNGRTCFEMPSLDDVCPVTYPDKVAKFIESVRSVGGRVVMVESDDDIKALEGADVGVVRGELAVAENGCVWVPQTMEDRTVMFISECLVIIVDRNDVVNNMHEAYEKINMPDYGYGCFISGPSKTADIAQALVMGAQAAREVVVAIKC